MSNILIQELKIYPKFEKSQYEELNILKTKYSKQFELLELLPPAGTNAQV